MDFLDLDQIIIFEYKNNKAIKKNLKPSRSNIKCTLTSYAFKYITEKDNFMVIKHNAVLV